MSKPEKRSIRLLKAPWLSQRSRLMRHKGDLRLVRKRRQRGFIIVGLLLLVVGLYFYLTNPSNLRRWAENYLRTLVNARVEVTKASFSFTEGIRLGKICIFATTWKPPEDLVFSARTVKLKISLPALLSGRLAASEITAYQPEVFLVEDSSGNWNYQPLFADRDFRLVYPLPAIFLREGRINYFEDIDGQPVLAGSLDLTAQLAPSGPEERTYHGTVETALGGRTVVRASGNFDAGTGAFTELTAQISLSESVGESLPRRVRAWMRDYGISGRLSVRGRYDPAVKTQLKSQLEGIAFRLPLPGEQAVSVSQGRGQLQFSESQILLGSIDSTQPGKILPVRFSALGGQWEISGRIDGYRPDADFDLTLACSDVSVPSDPDIIRSLPEVLRGIYADWEPSGRIALQVNLKRTGGLDSEILAQGYVRCLDVTGTFRQFPYQTRQITGLIHFDRHKATLEQMQARHQSRSNPANFVRFSAGGTVLAPYEDCYADIKVYGKNVIADEELRDALQEQDRNNWDLFDPVGTADLSCRLVHEPGMGIDWLSYIDCVLTGVSITYKEFPYTLTDLRGRVHIGPDDIEIGEPGSKTPNSDMENTPKGSFLTGRAGDGTVRLRGKLTHLGKADESVRLEVAGENIALDEKLAEALTPQARELFDTLNPSGTAQISGLITGSKERDPELDFTIDISPVNASCRHKDFPYPLEEIEGLIRLKPTRFEMIEFSARQGPATFSGSGFVATENQQQFEADLTIVGKDVVLDDLVRQSLQPDQREIWDELQPQGKCDVELNIFDDPAGQLSYRTTISLRSAGITYKPLAYSLSNLSGKVIIGPGLFDMNITSAEPLVTITGRIEGAQANSSANLKVIARDVALDEKLKGILPEGLQAVWDPLKPQGRVDLSIDSLKYSLSESGSKIWDLQGSVLLKDITLAKPLPCQGLSGEITGTSHIADKGPEVVCQGRLTLPELYLGPLLVTEVSGLFVKESAENPQWSFRNIKGKLAGGRVVAQLSGKFEREGLYTASIHVEDVDLAQLISEFESAKTLQPTADESEEGKVQGRLKALLKLEGKLSAADSPSGRGEILIEQAQLYRLPLLIRIMRVLSLHPVHSNAFDTASFDFYLDGQEVVFTEIALTGPALRMVGTGVFDRSEKSIHAVIVRDPPKNMWDILPTLSEAVVAEISGSLDEPQVQSKPFRDISEELKKLFRPRKPRKY